MSYNSPFPSPSTLYSQYTSKSAKAILFMVQWRNLGVDKLSGVVTPCARSSETLECAVAVLLCSNIPNITGTKPDKPQGQLCTYFIQDDVCFRVQ